MNGQKTVCFSHAYQRLSTHYFLPAFTFYPIYDFQNRFKHWPSTNNWLIFTDNFEVINYQPDPRSSVGGVGTGASMCRIMLRTAPKTEQLDYKLDLRTNLAKFYTGAESTQHNLKRYGYGEKSVSENLKTKEVKIFSALQVL